MQERDKDYVSSARKREGTRAGRTVGEVVDQGELRLVEGGSEVSLSDGESDGVGESLSEGSGGNLNPCGRPDRTSKRQRMACLREGERTGGKRTIGDVDLGVSGGDGSELPELLQVLDGELVAEEVKHDILKGATENIRKGNVRVIVSVGCPVRRKSEREDERVPVGEDESISVDPLGILGVGSEEPERRREDKGQQETAPGGPGRSRAESSEEFKTHLDHRTWAAGAIPIGAPEEREGEARRRVEKSVDGFPGREENWGGERGDGRGNEKRRRARSRPSLPAELLREL